MSPTSQVLYAEQEEVERIHTKRPVARAESARVWRNTALPGVELFHGFFRKHDFARHFHSALTVGVVDQGVMRSWSSRANHIAPAGSVILYNPHEVHAPGPGNTEGWSFRTFYIEDKLFSRASIPIANDGRLSLDQCFVQDEPLAIRLLQLHLASERRATSLELESSLLGVMMRLVQRYGNAPAPVKDSIQPEKIGRVRDYIHAHFPQDVTLATLSEISDFSQYHLLRAFRKAIGLTPHAYLIQTRIEAAKELLRSGLAPADVALSTGFVDQSHLNRHFKRLVGATPGQYYPETRARIVH